MDPSTVVTYDIAIPSRSIFEALRRGEEVLKIPVLDSLGLMKGELDVKVLLSDLLKRGLPIEIKHGNNESTPGVLRCDSDTNIGTIETLPQT